MKTEKYAILISDKEQLFFLEKYFNDNGEKIKNSVKQTILNSLNTGYRSVYFFIEKNNHNIQTFSDNWIKKEDTEFSSYTYVTVREFISKQLL